MTDDQQAPATADGAGRLSAEVITCLICAWEFGTVNGLWDHTRTHMLTPALYGQLSDTAKLRAALTTAERERDAYRHAAERNLDRLSALEEIDKEHADCQASIRVLIEHRDKVVRDLAASESRARALREALERSAAFWRPVAADIEHNILSIESVRFLAQDFLSGLQSDLAAADDGPGAADWQNAPSVNLLTGMLPSVETATVDGPGAAPSGEGMPTCCRSWAYDPMSHGDRPFTASGHHPACPEGAPAQGSDQEGA